MIRIRTDTFCHEHEVETVGIRIATHQVRHHIACGIDTTATLTEAPAELIAAVCGHHTAFVLFPAATPIDIPLTDILEGHTILIGYLQVAQLTPVQVTDHDIALRPLRINLHPSRFSDESITVLAQYYADIEVVELRACEGRGRKRTEQEEQAEEDISVSHAVTYILGSLFLECLVEVGIALLLLFVSLQIVLLTEVKDRSNDRRRPLAHHTVHLGGGVVIDHTRHAHILLILLHTIHYILVKIGGLQVGIGFTDGNQTTQYRLQSTLLISHVGSGIHILATTLTDHLDQRFRLVLGILGSTLGQGQQCIPTGIQLDLDLTQGVLTHLIKVHQRPLG